MHDATLTKGVGRKRRFRRHALISLWMAIWVPLVLLACIPQRYILKAAVPFVVAKGAFGEREVLLRAPAGRNAQVPVTIKLRMERGACRVSLQHGEKRTWWFSMGQGSQWAQISSDSVLVLDPQGDPGKYDVFIGPEWHPLAPKARRFLFLPMAVSMLVGSFVTGTWARRARGLGAGKISFLAALALITGGVLYPAVHEGGHMLLGMLAGGKPDWAGVVWTPLRGMEPHASFAYLPDAASPFMSAGGDIVPTVVAVLLLLAWGFCRTRTSTWYLSTALVAIPVIFLFSTAGCLFQLYHNTHMDALSVHYGLKGPLRIVFSLSPFLIAVVCYVWLGLQISKARSNKLPAAMPQ